MITKQTVNSSSSTDGQNRHQCRYDNADYAYFVLFPVSEFVLKVASIRSTEQLKPTATCRAYDRAEQLGLARQLWLAIPQNS